MEEAEISMNGGDGANSYAHNSFLQRAIMNGGKRIMEESLLVVYSYFVPDCLVAADLGCATGPNAFAVASGIIDVVAKTCSKMGHKTPSFLIHLNDLPGNDFNSNFKLLPEFYRGLENKNQQCFLSAMPGSFYGRLFPSNSLHFVHSSTALHWLSQVPNGLIREDGVAVNKGNICIGSASSPTACEAYLHQFEKDFDSFLKARSEEMLAGGVMVLTMLASITVNAPIGTTEVLGQALCDLANEGLIEESKLDAFNIPTYAPTADQVRRAVEKEGSFDVDMLEKFSLSWHAGMVGDTGELSARAEFAANFMRACTEQMLASTFGEAVMDRLFQKVVTKFYDHMNNGKDCENPHIVVSLKKKA